MSEKKKRPPVHDIFIEMLNEAACVSVLTLVFITNLYAYRDVVCPPAAIPELIKALQSFLSRNHAYKEHVIRAIANLQMQLEEYESAQEKEPVDWEKCLG